VTYHEELARPFCRFQLETELFLYRRKDRWRGGLARIVARELSHPFTPLVAEPEFEMDLKKPF
jgi:hypothetical protein